MIGWVYVGVCIVSMAISLIVLIVYTLKTTFWTLNLKKKQMTKEELAKFVRERRIDRLQRRQSLSRQSLRG